MSKLTFKDRIAGDVKGKKAKLKGLFSTVTDF